MAVFTPGEVDRLHENLERLRAHVEAVRKLSSTARDDIATVLHALVGGHGAGDGYGLVGRAFAELGLSMPSVPSWGTDIPDIMDGTAVVLALRGSPPNDGRTAPLLDHLGEGCLRFAEPGIPPQATWSYLELTKHVRNKFGSHVDQKPPRWLQELRFYPAGDSDVITLLLWRAAEVTLTSVSRSLIDAGVDIDPYEPQDRYLDGVAMDQAYVLCSPEGDLDVRAQIECPKWASGRRRLVVGALVDNAPFVFGLEGDARLAFRRGVAGQSVADIAEGFRLEGLPKVGRNDDCPCGSGRKFKYCHGKR